MVRKEVMRSLFFPLMLTVAFMVTADSVAAMGMGGEGKADADAKVTKMEGKEGHCKKGGMQHGSMGLIMAHTMPCKTMKFLNHFKKWVEITSEQEAAWGTFSKTIKLQTVRQPPMKQMGGMDPIAMAEKKIAKAERMLQMQKNTLEAYKALQKVLDKQQLQLADAFLMKHSMEHKGMKGGH